MIRVPNTALPHEAEGALLELQQRIDALASYEERVRQARELFAAENRKGNRTFDLVRDTLSAMCAGARRCMYCEDSVAAEVEHFRPKTFYPEVAFSWMNYLYSCGPCNRVKRDHFRILCKEGHCVDLVRRRNDPLAAPIDGQAVMLDPRTEDPLKFMQLDLANTFRFGPRHLLASSERERVVYTIDRLRLNDRDELLEARGEAFGAYVARLNQYIALRHTEHAQALVRALKRCGHPAVWSEMKVQSTKLPKLAELFREAPEAYGW